MRQPLRFVAVGIWNTIFGYAVFVAVLHLVRLALDGETAVSVTSVILANLIAIPQAYLSYKVFVFQTRGGWKRELPRFALSNTALPALNVLLLPLTIRFAPIGPLVDLAAAAARPLGIERLVDRASVSQAILAVLLALLAYLLHKHFSFRAPPDPTGHVL